ncbi:MAG: lactamase [Anaerolineaceae bacterium]|jgi:L-ascorbate metabolism protein UlaG (beta-lactamase superfamily)|nr:MAG: lactamase [Anaerolineaceae bacterium]
MEIVWYGHSCFRINERGKAAVVCDPYDHEVVGYTPLRLRAEITTVSHDSAGHNCVKCVKGNSYLINGPGEYEIGGVFITGLSTTRRVKKSAENSGNNGAEVDNTLYMIDYGGITIAHLGDMVQVPTQAEVESLGPVNIALVPVGDGNSLNASKAAEVISLLEPNIVIPMHYATADSKVKLDPISKFLKEMGLSEIETQESFKVNSVTDLPEDTQVVILDYSIKS